jgi:hypothetical protein
VIYHAARQPDRKLVPAQARPFAIYLLIAGTYTPFTLLAIRSPWGWVLFGVVWTLATIGIAAKLTVGFRYPRLSTALYLGMGWVGIFAIPLADNVSNLQLALDPRRRTGLHRRRAVLRLEVPSLHARGVAPVRAGRCGLPLCRRAQPGDVSRRAEPHFLRRGGARFFAAFFTGFFTDFFATFLAGFFAGCFAAGFRADDLALAFASAFGRPSLLPLPCAPVSPADALPPERTPRRGAGR